jgi:2-polyprenyl-3-methyl-5-hydroxy-6-metoxy-1,4-benzoquinol methylase
MAESVAETILVSRGSPKCHPIPNLWLPLNAGTSVIRGCPQTRRPGGDESLPDSRAVTARRRVISSVQKEAAHLTTRGESTVSDGAFGPVIDMVSLKAKEEAVGDEMAVPYMLDNTAAERVRLSRQALELRPMTERLFRAAGIGPGMSVLDVGCGVGDVSFLAAELVSSSGRVIGFDRDPRQVRAASARSGDTANVSFVEATVDDPPEGEFDAVVGQLVLTHQPDLVAAVSSLVRRVRPGGVVAFVELNRRADGTQSISWPQTPLEERVRSWVRAGQQSTNFLVGLQLPSLFRRAGLVPQPPYDSGAIIYEGRDRAEMCTGIVRSLLPTLTKAGVDARDIDIDTLSERLYAEGGDQQIRVLGPFIGVWARKPE